MGNPQESIVTLQTLLQQASTPRTKAWWESYMKGVIPFRGVGTPRVIEVLKQWLIDYQIQTLPLEDQLEIALTLMREPIAEDKLTGILFLQYHLIDQLDWQELIAQSEDIYNNEFIFDWNICDWFCVRVLSPTILNHGYSCAEAIAAWHSKEYLWQSRSSVVAFVKVAKNQEYHSLIERSCLTLIHRKERFAKTAVGWILREISKSDRLFVGNFVKDNLPQFSLESLKNATKNFDKPEKENYLKLFKTL